MPAAPAPAMWLLCKDDITKCAPQTPAPEAGKVKRITRIEDTPEYAAFQERFRAIHGENPYFVCHESPLMDTSVMDGHEVLNFGSYNYAGMSGRPETVNAAIEATRKYGTSASGSRLLGGEKKLRAAGSRHCGVEAHRGRAGAGIRPCDQRNLCGQFLRQGRSDRIRRAGA